MTTTLRIHLLGDFLLESDDTPALRVAVPRLQSLLAYLILQRSAPQDRSRLAFLLWPDSSEAQAHTNLRKLLYLLRQSFPEVERFIQSGRHSLQWLPTCADSAWTLDIKDVEDALIEAEQAERLQDTAVLRRALEQVLRLYRGDLLPACYDEWILPERDRWRQVFLSAAERLITLLEGERAYPAAIEAARRLLRYDPLHEETYRQLMRLYALRGDRVAALRVYHTCVTALERELGTAPAEVTRAVYESLLLAPAREQPGSPRAPRGTGAPLVGRRAQWRQLLSAWRQAANGHPQVVILSGEAGIGKTRLAEEMEAWVGRQGMTTASAQCYAAEGRLAYAPVATWLRAEAHHAGLAELDQAWLAEIGRLLPEVLAARPEVPRPTAMTEGWQRQHLFEALARAVLGARQPLLLLLDDLHWCDNETLEWLHYLLRSEPRARLLLIGTVRAGEAMPGDPLLTFLSAWQREGLLTEVALGPLTAAETTTLAEHVAGSQLDPALADRLSVETEGNPLFVVEMVRAGSVGRPAREQRAGDQPHPLLSHASSSLPPTVQSVLETRLAQLSPLGRAVAKVAAVIGREFSFPVLALASGEPEDNVVRGLDELWQRRLVREQGAGTAQSYDFSHDKLREQAYLSLGPAHKRLLHRRIAEALEVVHAGNLDAVCGQVATHFERAGQPGRAIPYYRCAGEVALRIYANAEALAAFQRAAALLGNAQPEQPWVEAAAIYVSLGDIYALTGRLQEARSAYQEGMEHAATRAASPHTTAEAAGAPAQADLRAIWRARLLRKMASTWNLASDNPLDTFHVNALQAYQEAESCLARAAERSGAVWLREWIDLQIDQLLPLRGSLGEMTVIIEKAQAVVEHHGTAEQRAKFFQAVVARDGKRDRYVISEEAVEHCRAALAAVKQTGNMGLIGFAHFILGIRLLLTDRLAEAAEEMHAAILIAEQTGYSALLARCLAFLPFIFRGRGQVEEVRSAVTRALAVPEAQNIAIVKAHQAWLAWRDGDLAAVETFGKASIQEDQLQRNANAFQWAGLWPLLGAALVRGSGAEAMPYVRMLLAPTLQPPPSELRTLLEAAQQAWDAGRQDEAQAFLRQVAARAQQSGYL